VEAGAPSQLIVSPQFGFGKAEQFIPELKWQKESLEAGLEANSPSVSAKRRGKNWGICDPTA